jgi:hypothetical protein
VVVVAAVAPAVSDVVAAIEEGALVGETATAETVAPAGEGTAVGTEDEGTVVGTEDEGTVVQADEGIVAAAEEEGLVGIEDAEIAVAAGCGEIVGETVREETAAALADAETVGIVDGEIVASGIGAGVAIEWEAVVEPTAGVDG